MSSGSIPNAQNTTQMSATTRYASRLLSSFPALRPRYLNISPLHIVSIIDIKNAIASSSR